MIAANVEAAVALRSPKPASLYRVHGQPEDKRVTELQKVLNALQVGAAFSGEADARASFANWSSGWPRDPTACCSRAW